MGRGPGRAEKFGLFILKGGSQEFVGSFNVSWEDSQRGSGPAMDFRDGHSEAQRGEVTCQKSHGKLLAKGVANRGSG